MNNFQMVAGDTKILNVTVRNSAGAAVDITDPQHIKFQLFPVGAGVGGVAKQRSNPVVRKSLSSGIILIDSLTGQFSITLNAQDTKNLDPGVYYYEIELKNSTGQVATVASGRITINQGLVL